MASAPVRSVAFTGQNSGWLAMAGLTFLAFGTLLIGAAMKRRKHDELADR
ncbi:MAG: hypothetical protein H6512_08525 [Acidimicrobiia bacterium]|nr:hypothetical protein [Acidimicrobiia bacterium]